MTKTMENASHQTDADLAVKRAEVESRLAASQMAPEAAELIRKANDAVVAFKDEVATYERQIEEIDATVGAREKHRRQEAEHDRQARLKEQQTQLGDLEGERLKAVADAEAGARQLADGLGRTLEINRKMAQLGAAQMRIDSVLARLAGDDKDDAVAWFNALPAPQAMAILKMMAR